MRENVDEAAFAASQAALAGVDVAAVLARMVPIDTFVPLVLPASWRRGEPPGLPRLQACFEHTRAPLRVLMTCARERDDKRWLHVSICHQRRLPDWEDLREAKDIFIGAGRLAVQVLPRAAEYVNIHANVLHLWSCLDGDPVPDFRVGGAI